MAMTGYSAVPPGWNYDAMTDSYVNAQGLKVNRIDIIQHGGIVNAIRAIHSPQAIANAINNSGPGYGGGKVTNRPYSGATGSPNQMATPPGANGATGNPFAAASSHIVPNGSWTDIHSKSKMRVTTKRGSVTADLETGELTFPPEVGKDQALREFWLAFQEHFQPTNKEKYEKEIFDLKHEKDMLAELLKQEKKAAANLVVEKVRKKYGNEKFIMVKPDDLIKFIEEG